MTKQELQQKQEELDEEDVFCSKCGTETVWGVWREIGCLECYHRSQENKTETPKEQAERIKRETFYEEPKKKISRIKQETAYEDDHQEIKDTLQDIKDEIKNNNK